MALLLSRGLAVEVTVKTKRIEDWQSESLSAPFLLLETLGVILASVLFNFPVLLRYADSKEEPSIGLIVRCFKDITYFIN